MKVTIMYRNSYHGGDGWTYYPKEISISDNCPKCGNKRGMPEVRNFCEDGDFYQVHIWKNQCGHIDLYKDVYSESLAIKRSSAA